MTNRVFFAKALSRKGGGKIATSSRAALSAVIGPHSESVQDWSHTMSFAQAESDFAASDRFAHSAFNNVGPVWSGTLSFASPESDLVAEQVLVSAPPTALGAVHSNEMLVGDDGSKKERARQQQQSQLAALLSESHHLFSSPESALGVVHVGEMLPLSESSDSKRAQHQQQSQLATLLSESHLISSPESALGVVHAGEMLPSTESSHSKRAEHQQQSQLASLLSESHHLFSSPESALGVVHVGEMLPLSESSDSKRAHQHEQPQLATLLAEPDHLFPSPESAVGVVHAGEMMGGNNRSSTSSSPSFQESSAREPIFSSPESATGTAWYTEMLDDSLKQALIEHQAAKDALPKTLSEALSDERPIVITSAASPFHVVDVNAAWEGLCGYSREEAVHRNIGELLQGPETNVATATDMIRYLKRDSFSKAVLTNYTKDGRKFQNRISVGVISSDGDEAGRAGGPSNLYFVGVLEDLEAAGNKKLSMA